MSSTVIDLPGLDARGKGTVLFVPAIAAITAPKVTELTAATALNMSCILYEFEVTLDQSAVEKPKYCSVTMPTRPGTAKYTISDITYDYDPQKITSADPYKHYATLAPGTQGYLVDRRGLLPSVAPTVAQIVDVYPIVLGARQRVKIDPTAEGESLRVTQKVFLLSDPAFDVALVA